VYAVSIWRARFLLMAVSDEAAEVVTSHVIRVYFIYIYIYLFICIYKVKGKVFPLQARCGGPEGG
jgi:hypothetical protein